MYFNSAGWFDGIKKFLVVALWVALSGAVAGLIAWISNLPINNQDIFAVAIVGLVNAALAGIAKWISTKN